MESKLTIDDNNTKEWKLSDGKWHREVEPAIEYSDGTKEWWLNGQRHREDGPAVEYSDGRKYWYINGKLHREDGPAVEFTNGLKSWWLNGIEYTESSEYKCEMRSIKLIELLK
jgi:hypothetical protein